MCLRDRIWPVNSYIKVLCAYIPLIKLCEMFGKCLFLYVAHPNIIRTSVNTVSFFSNTFQSQIEDNILNRFPLIS